MSFYQEQQQSQPQQQSGWGAPARQTSWEQQQQAPPSRSGANSAAAREDAMAFHSQIDEVDRAIDNLVKSDPRTGPRHHSVSEFDGGRTGGNVQSFYQNQRHAPRNDADSVLQAKRRMAAQRERELRNYHQEQQYNRSVLADTSTGKSDRSYSPNAMNEDERRELIARQHRALYGDNSSLYSGEGSASRPISQDARVGGNLGGPRGGSPLAFDQFGMQGIGAGDAVQMPSREQPASAGKEQQGSERDNSTASPSSNQNNSYGLFDNAQQSSRTTNSSPTGASSPQGQGPKGAAGVAPIGTRPNAGQATAAGQSMNKRSTTPLPSPLSYGFSASEQQAKGADRAGSAASNPTAADKGAGLGAWGSNSGVWGNAPSKLGVQASVWG